MLPPAELPERQQGDSIPKQGRCEVQLLRSASFWSIGQPVEQSIHDAYLHAIHAAEHFIYIENQFFISATDDDGDFCVRNQIARAICDRIIRAHREKRKFFVYLVLPLLPAFESKVHENGAYIVRQVVHWHQVCLASAVVCIDLL